MSDKMEAKIKALEYTYVDLVGPTGEVVSGEICGPMPWNDDIEEPVYRVYKVEFLPSDVKEIRVPAPSSRYPTQVILRADAPIRRTTSPMPLDYNAVVEWHLRNVVKRVIGQTIWGKTIAQITDDAEERAEILRLLRLEQAQVTGW